MSGYDDEIEGMESEYAALEKCMNQQRARLAAELDNLKAENADLISSNKAYQLSSGLALQERDNLKAENAALREALRDAVKSAFSEGYNHGPTPRSFALEDYYWNKRRTQRMLEEVGDE